LAAHLLQPGREGERVVDELAEGMVGISDQQFGPGNGGLGRDRSRSGFLSHSIPAWPIPARRLRFLASDPQQNKLPHAPHRGRISLTATYTQINIALL
jgi:hypothetical protein